MMLADMGAEIIKIETAMGRTRQFDRGPANGCNRRVSPVAAHSGDRLLSKPTAGTQPCLREPLFMPHT
jgi:hypothetical protein